MEKVINHVTSNSLDFLGHLPYFLFCGSADNKIQPSNTISKKPKY